MFWFVVYSTIFWINLFRLWALNFYELFVSKFLSILALDLLIDLGFGPAFLALEVGLSEFTLFVCEAGKYCFLLFPEEVFLLYFADSLDILL